MESNWGLNLPMHKNVSASVERKAFQYLKNLTGITEEPKLLYLHMFTHCYIRPIENLEKLLEKQSYQLPGTYNVCVQPTTSTHRRHKAQKSAFRSRSFKIYSQILYSFAGVLWDKSENPNRYWRKSFCSHSKAGLSTVPKFKMIYKPNLNLETSYKILLKKNNKGMFSLVTWIEKSGAQLNYVI